MAVYQTIPNLDELARSSKVPIEFVNDLDVLDTEEKREKLQDLISTHYHNSELLSLPQCECGYKLAFEKGTKCELCGGAVTDVQEDIDDTILWLRRPKDSAKLLNPAILMMLKERFKKNGFCVIQYLMDIHYRPTNTNTTVYEGVSKMGFIRGYNYFIENFWTIVDTLLDSKLFASPVKKKDDVALRGLFEKYKDNIFSDVLPLPNKALLVVERTHVSYYVDPNIRKALDAIMSMSGIDSEDSMLTPAKVELRVARCLLTLADFHYSYIKNNLSPKEGVIRRNIFGSRAHFTTRGVITSITKPHDYRVVELPWLLGNAILRPHILNKLKRKGYRLVEAVNFLHRYADTYNDMLSSIHSEIISENITGIPMLMARNPTLLIGSQMPVRAIIKPDTSDKTIGISILNVNPLNAWG